MGSGLNQASQTAKRYTVVDSMEYTTAMETPRMARTSKTPPSRRVAMEQRSPKRVTMEQRSPWQHTPALRTAPSRFSTPEYFGSPEVDTTVQTPAMRQVTDVDLLKERLRKQDLMISELVRENVELRAQLKTGRSARKLSLEESPRLAEPRRLVERSPRLIEKEQEPSFGKEAADFVADFARIIDLDKGQHTQLASIMDRRLKNKRWTP